MFPPEPRTSHEARYIKEVDLESPQTPTPSRTQTYPSTAAINSSPTPPRFTAINRPVEAISSHFSPQSSSRNTLQETLRSTSQLNLNLTQTKGQGVPLLPISVLPDSVRSLFSFDYFNPMQSKTFDSIYGCDKNIVLSAPTGSGKTTCFELAIVRLMKQDPSGDFKV